jgi:hypothetical protein
MSMAREELLELERAGWEALSAGGDAAAAFYDRVLATEVLMLLPGGMVLVDRAAVVDSMRGDPWSSYEMFDERVIELSESCAVVAYRARATRGGTEYSALITSTFVRTQGEWKLAVHQQTPT